MVFLVAPTVAFSVLYGFFVISYGRRQILCFNITMNPTSSWIIRQSRQALPFALVFRFLIFGRDARHRLVKSLEERYRWACYSVFWEQFPSAC